jgi:hypothetical protein
VRVSLAVTGCGAGPRPRAKPSARRASAA